MAGVVRNPGLSNFQPILPVSNPTSLEFHMGLFADIFNACSRAMPKGTTRFSNASAQHAQAAPQRAFASAAKSPSGGDAPVPGMVLGAVNTPALVSGKALGNSGSAAPVLKMRTCFEHDLQQPKAHRRVRMVISGRMADVCAELERLAAIENRLNTTMLH